MRPNETSFAVSAFMLFQAQPSGRGTVFSASLTGPGCGQGRSRAESLSANAPVHARHDGQLDIDVWGSDALRIRNSHTPDCSLIWTSSWPVRAQKAWKSSDAMGSVARMCSTCPAASRFSATLHLRAVGAVEPLHVQDRGRRRLVIGKARAESLRWNHSTPAGSTPDGSNPGWLDPGMIGHAELVHGVHEHPHVLRIGVGLDAVAEVEDMAGAGAEARQQRAHLGPDALGGGVERQRVEVALWCDPVAHAAPRGPEVLGPVESHGLAAGRRDRLDPPPPALGEQDHGGGAGAAWTPATTSAR